MPRVARTGEPEEIKEKRRELMEKKRKNRLEDQMESGDLRLKCYAAKELFAMAETPEEKMAFLNDFWSHIVDELGPVPDALLLETFIKMLKEILEAQQMAESNKRKRRR